MGRSKKERQQAAGTYRANRDKTRPAKPLPAQPGPLNEFGQALYDVFIEQSDPGLIQPTHVHSLYSMCQNYDDYHHWRERTEEAEQEELPTSEIAKRRRMADSCFANFCNLMRLFGGTPKSLQLLERKADGGDKKAEDMVQAFWDRQFSGESN
jgi:hypothetical protein